MSENENVPAPPPGEGEGPVVTEQAAERPAEAVAEAEQKPAPAAAGGDGATGAGGAPGAVPSTNGSGSRAAESPVPHPRPQFVQPDDAVAVGSVPTPPPWRRAPGEDGAARSSAKAQRTLPPVEVDALLSEAPTAYLETQPPAESGELPRAEIPVTKGRLPRQALLQIKRFDPWSVLKLALVLAVVVFFIWLVAVGVLYGVLDGIGVWDRLNGTYNDLVSGQTDSGGSLISAGRVFGIAAVVGAINSVLFAVAITVGAFVYNVSSDLVGGIEVTLSERD